MDLNFCKAVYVSVCWSCVVSICERNLTALRSMGNCTKWSDCLTNTTIQHRDRTQDSHKRLITCVDVLPQRMRTASRGKMLSFMKLTESEKKTQRIWLQRCIRLSFKSSDDVSPIHERTLSRKNNSGRMWSNCQKHDDLVLNSTLKSTPYVYFN